MHSVLIVWLPLEAVVPRRSIEQLFLKIFSKFTLQHLLESPSKYSYRSTTCNFAKERTTLKGFSYEFCELYATPVHWVEQYLARSLQLILSLQQQLFIISYTAINIPEYASPLTRIFLIRTKSVVIRTESVAIRENMG